MGCRRATDAVALVDAAAHVRFHFHMNVPNAFQGAFVA